MINEWHQPHSRRWSVLWSSSSLTWGMGKATSVKSQDSSHGHCFSMSIFWAPQHIWWVASGTFFFSLNRPKPRDSEESVSTASWLVPGSWRQATECPGLSGWAKFRGSTYSVVQRKTGIATTCLSSSPAYLQTCSVPQVHGEESHRRWICLHTLGQVQAALLPLSFPHLVQTDWRGSISSLAASLLLFLLLCRNKNFQRRAKRVMTSMCPHLCFGW